MHLETAELEAGNPVPGATFSRMAAVEITMRWESTLKYQSIEVDGEG